MKIKQFHVDPLFKIIGLVKLQISLVLIHLKQNKTCEVVAIFAIFVYKILENA